MATVLAYKQAHLERRAKVQAPGLAELVETIGLDDFGAQILALFDRIVGADHCVAYQMRNYELAEIVSGAEEGVMIPDAYLSTYDIHRRFRHMGQSPAHVEIYDLPTLQTAPCMSLFKPQGILMMGSRADALYCVRILRMTERQHLSEDDVEQLQEVADLVLSLVARHHDLFQARPTSFTALSSLDLIEARIASTKALSRRESEVCARILYGHSSCGIAVDLGIGKESVMTYRKRAYQHLGIGSQRELLMWYLEQTPVASCN